MPSNSNAGKPSINKLYKSAWLNNTLQALFLLNSSGRIIEYNRKAERLMKNLTGKKLKKGEEISEFIFREEKPEIIAQLQNAEKGRHSDGEFIIKDTKENDRWYTYSISPVKGDGKISIISFGLIEITDQKISESELKERNKEQKCLYDISRLDEMNLSVDELIRNALELLPDGFQYPDLIEAVITYRDKKYKTENYKESKPKLTAVSDRVTDHVVKIEFISNKKGKEADIGFLNKELDLIEAVANLLSLKLLQIKTRRDLEIERERFDYALKASEDVIYDHDMEADTISISENFQNIFGYSFADEPFTLEKWAELLHPDDEERINNRLNKTLAEKNKNKWEAEFRYARKDGTYANVKENAYIIRDDDGQPVRMIGTVRDITESKHRELKKELSSNISRIFNESGTLRDTLNKALYEVKNLGEYKFAEIWLVNHDRSLIELTSYIAKNNEQFYEEETEKDSFKIGEGLPGKTWKSGKVQFWKNLDTRKTFIRSAGAEKANLKTGYGFPVSYNSEITGVLLLGTEENLNKPQPLAGILEDLAEQLGEEIHRKKLEEELSRIFISAPDGIIVAGFDGYLKKVNPAMSQILGYSEEELLNTPFIEFVHPDDRENTLKFYEEANSGTEKSFFENRYITKSGQVVWLSWTFKVFHEEELTYSVAKNITEQKELEQLLKQSNRLAKIGSWEVDLIKNEIYWSNITREILGVGHEVEPSMEKGLDLYKEGESRDKMNNAIQKAIEKGTSWDIEVKIVVEPGNEKWVRSIGEAEIAQGKCVRLYGSLQDIHEKKELEELLEKANRLARIGSWEVDLVKEKVYWGEMTREIHEVGPDFEPELNTNIQFYKEGEHREEINRAVTRAIEEGEPFDLELQIVTAKGNERWVRAIGEAELIDGKPVRIYGSFQDIHDRKVAEEELREKTDHIDAIAQLNAALLNYRDWFGALERHLEVIGEAVVADRVYFFENRFDPDTGEGYTTQKLEWCREGIEPQLGNPDLDEIPFSEVPELVEPMIDRKPSTRKLSDVPKGSMTEYVMLDQQMKTFLAIPIYIKDHFHGFVGFDNCTIEKDWSDEEMITLKTIASNLAIAIERQKADEELQSAFEEKNTILESIGDAFFALDTDWTVTYWNHKAEEVLGMPREKIVGENLWELYEDATSLEFYTQYHKAVNEQVTVHFEEYYPTLEKWFEVSAYPSETGLSVFFKDVTERKEAQKLLVERTNQLDAIAMFNSLLIKEDSWKIALEKAFPAFGELVNCDRVYYFNNDSGPDGEQTISMTQEWVEEGISPRIDNPDHHNVPHTVNWDFIDPLLNRKLFNHTVKDIKNKKFRELLEQQEIKSLLALPVFTGSEFQGFIGFDDCTTGRTWREEEISFLKTITINLASAIENEDAEEALQKAFEEKNEILESIGDGFFTVDNNFTVTYWNQNAEELLLTPREKVIDKNLWEVFDKEQANESYRQYSRALKEQKALKFEDYYEPIDRWFDVNVYPSQNGISVFFKDITDRKEADQLLKELNRSLEDQAKELAASNAELEQFAFVASHDLQEPLRMITGFLAQLERKYEDVLDEKGKKYIHFAIDGAKRMRQIILDLLNYSRVGRVDTEREEVDVNTIVDDAMLLNQTLLQENKAEVHIGKLPTIYASSGPIRQLFQNVISNALKYHKKDSKPIVNIRAEETDEYWEFMVKDNGIGISPEYSDKIFNIFQRLHGKEEYSGTGVGLAICKKIVEEHGGTIWVESEPGKGSTFYFTIAKKQRVFEDEE